MGASPSFDHLANNGHAASYALARVRSKIETLDFMLADRTCWRRCYNKKLLIETRAFAARLEGVLEAHETVRANIDETLAVVGNARFQSSGGCVHVMMSSCLRDLEFKLSMVNQRSEWRRSLVTPLPPVVPFAPMRTMIDLTQQCPHSEKDQTDETGTPIEQTTIETD